MKLAVALATALAGGWMAVAPAGAAVDSSCSAPPSAAGDWPTAGADLNGSRSQPKENSITPAAAQTLAPAWSFYTGHPSGGPQFSLGDLQSTPVEYGGCLYFGSAVTDPAYPNAFAVDVATGHPVWQRHLDVAHPAIGGAVVGSPAIAGDAVVFLVNDKGDGSSSGPYAVGLDRHTGDVLWHSAPLVTETNSFTNASPVVADGVVIAGFSAEEGNADRHGGFALIDATSGAILARTYTIPPSDWVMPDGEHMGGGGVWTAPAVDLRSGYAYMGTGNPFSKQSEHPNTNAIIKVDVDPSRATFGQIVGSYKGTIDQSNGVVKTATGPTCAVAPDDPLQQLPQQGDPRLQTLQGILGDSPTCGQLDLDFGAAPNLFQSGGRLIVGDLQKSGVYHAVYADDMQGAWTKAIGSSCHVCNGASTALDPARGTIYADASPGSVLKAFPTDGGDVAWSTPAADIFHYPPVSIADGVVYTIDNGSRFLDVFDAASGALLNIRPFNQDGAPEAATIVTSAGVAIARNTVFVPAGSHMLAYRPTPGTSPGGLP
jgi:outer membrane protein assembly factor BamB